MSSLKGDDKDDEIARMKDKIESMDSVVMKSTKDVKDKTQKIERLQVSSRL